MISIRKASTEDLPVLFEFEQVILRIDLRSKNLKRQRLAAF
jgi:hypothetical protein